MIILNVFIINIVEDKVKLNIIQIYLKIFKIYKFINYTKLILN